MLSGIGPADHLGELGLAVEVDAPEVGRNLQDHPFMGCVWETNGDSLLEAEHPRYLAEWLFRRSGPLTSSVAEAFAFVRSRSAFPPPTFSFTSRPPTTWTTASRSSRATPSRRHRLW